MCKRRGRTAGANTANTTSSEPSSNGRRFGEATANRASGCRRAAYLTASFSLSVPHKPAGCVSRSPILRRKRPSPQPAARTSGCLLAGGHNDNARKTSDASSFACVINPPASKNARRARMMSSCSSCSPFGGLLAGGSKCTWPSLALSKTWPFAHRKALLFSLGSSDCEQQFGQRKCVVCSVATTCCKNSNTTDDGIARSGSRPVLA